MNENAKLIAKFLSVLPSLPEFLFNNLTSNQIVKSPQTTDDHDTFPDKAIIFVTG